MQKTYKCAVCGSLKHSVEKYELTYYWVNRENILEDIICSDCINRLKERAKIISEKVNCESCGKEVSIYKVNSVPILATRDEFDTIAVCDECYHHKEDDTERLQHGEEIDHAEYRMEER